MRYGGTPSRPGDFFPGAGAEDLRSSTVGGGGAGSCGRGGMRSRAEEDQGVFRWRIRCIFPVGVGTVDCAGGMKSVCLKRR